MNGNKYCFFPDINDENIYEEIPDEVSALNDPLETFEWLDLYEGNIKNNLLKDLVKAKFFFENKTRNLKLIERLSLQSEEKKSGSLEL